MESHHAFSNNFPFRKHPLTAEFDEQLSRLRSSLEASSSSTSVVSKLSRLQDLHNCVDQLLLLPLNQQAVSKEQNEQRVDELLDGSLRIFDICSVAKDTLSQMKESTQDLQSILRRKRGSEKGLVTSEVNKFLSSRKSAKKECKKALESRRSLNREGVEIVGVLREVESVTLAVFESLIPFISMPKSQAKSSGWSFVSKLMHSRRVTCEEISEFERADSALRLLVGAKKSESALEENAQKQLQKLEMCIQDLEEGVESLILNH